MRKVGSGEGKVIGPIKDLSEESKKESEKETEKETEKDAE